MINAPHLQRIVSSRPINRTALVTAAVLAVGILALGLLSSWFSARRVLRIDPAQALTGSAAG